MGSIEKPTKNVALRLYDIIPEGKLGDDVSQILGEVFGQSREEMEQFMDGRLLDSYLGIATEDDESGESRAVGAIVFSLPKSPKNKSGYIGAVAVSPDRRSIRTLTGEIIRSGQGIGTDLARAAIKYMVGRGVERIEGERLPSSVGFWDSMENAKVGDYGQEYVDVEPEHPIVVDSPHFEDCTANNHYVNYELVS